MTDQLISQSLMNAVSESVQNSGTLSDVVRVCMFSSKNAIGVSQQGSYIEFKGLEQRLLFTRDGLPMVIRYQDLGERSAVTVSLDVEGSTAVMAPFAPDSHPTPWSMMAHLAHERGVLSCGELLMIIDAYHRSAVESFNREQLNAPAYA